MKGRLIISLPAYRFWRFSGYPRLLPFTYIFMLTHKCNSKCKTCFIWKMYEEDPQLEKEELKTWEFGEIFRSIGKNIFWITLGGGEPFLRKDLVEICELIDTFCSPFILHLLSNATLPKIITKKFKAILEKCNFPHLKINLSLDGIGKKHDEIRGMKGNFKKFLLTYQKLKKLQSEFGKFKIGIHTVISSYNINLFDEILEYVLQLDPDTFIFELAERRREFLNTKSDIMPSFNEYVKLIDRSKGMIKKRFLNQRTGIVKLTQAFKLEYYNLSLRILKKKRQILPCYAGYSFCHINAFGDVWPCGVQADRLSFGNLREVNYDFRRVWFSKEADKVRKILKRSVCYCPLATVQYTNMVCNMSSLYRVLKHLV